MVGILIVLVMIVGVRASSADAPPEPRAAAAAPTASKDADSLQAELEAAYQRALGAHEEINKAADQIGDMTVQRAVIESRREQLSLVRAAVERDIEERRSKLDESGQRQFDVQREIAEIEIQLHKLTQEQVSLSGQTAEAEVIECVPTPLAKTVDGDGIHVRLKHGQLALVPANELLAEIHRRGSDHLRNGLSSRNRGEDVFGPINGFRMRFSVEKFDEPAPEASDPANIVLQCVFMPMTDDIGQPVEQALLPGSPLMTALRAKPSSVTVWLYSDSFEDLRAVKQLMWDQGIPLAVRPLTGNRPIIFSTSGTRSVAQ
jgi:hypothetical protein